MRLVLAAAVLGLLALAGCGGSGDGSDASSSSGGYGGSAPDTSGARYPTVLEAELTPEGEGTYDVAVTISSEYDSPERYADGWRVLDPSGEVLGEHELAHDHAGEQPFTRTQTGLEIADGVETVTVEGRDSENGYGGKTVDVEVPSG